MEYFIETLNRIIYSYPRENILIIGDHLKLADLGSCKGVYSKHPYTEYISTRWYRSPECLMTDGYYD
jgi:renal tumor antigen